MLRTNPCRCHARPGRYDAVLEFEHGECARCGRFLPWAISETWEDGLGLRALHLAVEDAALVLRAAAREQGVEGNGDYVEWLDTGGADKIDVVGGVKQLMRGRDREPVAT